jgi:serine/threonine protein phosphatase PrpC
MFRRLISGGSKRENKRHADVSNPAHDASNLKSNPMQTKYRVASCQSKGRERSHNEDTLFTLNSLIGGMEAPLSFGIYLVADGMGGHQNGELASNLAAQGVSQYLIDQVFHAYLFERKSLLASNLMQTVLDAVQEAQNLVLQRVPGGGTTLTLVMAVDDDLFSAHVGDSRLYLVGADGSLTLKTRDHTLVKRLVDLGEISTEEAGSHPHRNVLYRALGQSDPFVPDTEIFSMNPGERLLICSDGLSGVLDQQELLQVIDNTDDLDEMAINLVRAANDAGGPDNISVVLVERLDRFKQTT